jgi:hypothetical protein
LDSGENDNDFKSPQRGAVATWADVPDSIDLSTPDVLGHTLIAPSNPAGLN